MGKPKPTTHIQEITYSTWQWWQSAMAVSVVDVRPVQESAAWLLHGRLHIHAYDKLKLKDPYTFQRLHPDNAIPAVADCAGGKANRVAAEILQPVGSSSMLTWW